MKNLSTKELQNIKGGFYKKPPKEEDINPPILRSNIRFRIKINFKYNH